MFLKYVSQCLIFPVHVFTYEWNLQISEEFNVAVLMTNHVMSDPSGAMFISDPKKPVGGHVIAHASTVRLSVRKGKQDQRVIKVIQAPHLADGEETFVIGDGGVLDCSD